MRTTLALLTLGFCCSLAFAGGVKEKLIGKWTGEVGQGGTRVVTTLQFLENGEFRRTVMMGTREFTPISSGKWMLTTAATGLKAITADPDKLILTYKLLEPSRISDKTEAFQVKITKNAASDGKEMLNLGPVDGSILGTQYYYRAR